VMFSVRHRIGYKGYKPAGQNRRHSDMQANA